MEKTNRQFNNNSSKLQCHILINGRTCRQKINKETEDLNNTVNQLDLIDIYRIPTNSRHSPDEST